MFASAMNRLSGRSKKPDTVKPSEGVTTRRAFGRDITNANPETIDTSKKSGTSKGDVAGVEADAIDVDMSGGDAAVEPATQQRVYMLRPSDDIDIRDVDNPLLCTEYVNEMYDIFNDTEKEYAVKPNYMSEQPYINEKMRSILCDWLVEVHLRFKMVPETLYLTVNILDRYLEKSQIRRSKLQLVGVAAMSLASKYEEIYPPDLRDWVHITDHSYSREQIVSMESDIANKLEYNFTVPTTHAFLCRYLKAAHADRTMVQLACFLAERSLQEYSMCNYLPSIIAATAVLISRKTLRRHPWSPTLVKYTKYDEPALAACIAEMKTILSSNSQQQAVAKKYASSKFGGVATLTVEF